MIYIPFHEALQRLLSIALPIKRNKFVSIYEALNCVAFEDIKCIKNLPAFNNSALDGYGFNYEDKNNNLKISKTILAGNKQNPTLAKNECYKIMTGAMIPSDIDTIVAFEDAIKIDEEHIKIPSFIKKYNAFRFCGEEKKIGDILIKKGDFLTPSAIMMCASQGISFIKVFSKPKIAIISTGDEIKEPWEKIDDHHIYNANSSGIISLLKKNTFEADYIGVVPDNLEKCTEFFKNLKSKYDIIISSGGVSMGEADFVFSALKANAFQEVFHGVNIKPGRPILCGTMDDVLVISLPGNPMAAFLNAFLFALSAVKKRAGYKNVSFQNIKAINQKKLSFKANRTNIILGFYENGKFFVTDDNKYGSNMISPLLKSNCLIISKENEDHFDVGDEIDVIIF